MSLTDLATSFRHLGPVEELIPETVRGGDTDVATLGFVVGFAVMMALDNLLG
jgi:zinc transporter, ZIP family